MPGASAEVSRLPLHFMFTIAIMIAERFLNSYGKSYAYFKGFNFVCCLCTN